MAGPFKPLRYRQIHLDFHTSEAISGIGRDFDADDFAHTLQDANVNAVCLFARCHHGWCYYPSEVGASHPGLARPDLLGEMITACRAADIEAPVYITVQWDENLARTRPEWLAMPANNKPHDNTVPDGSMGYQLTASWHTLCLNNAEYRQYLIDMGQEIIERYDPPGLFYDIVGSHECVCPKCVARMQAEGLDPTVAADRRNNDEAINEAFRQQVSGAIWGAHPTVRLFYNSGHINKGVPGRFDTYSHLEIESLPTGPWGYDHFPGNARYAAALGKDYLGQTGKFHTSWGEFGGYKQSDALIYECAQMVAQGAKCLIGDQLHPLGVMDPDTYRFIAPAYAHVKRLEPYLDGAAQISEVAILAAECFAAENARSQPSDDGAVRMLLESHIPFDMVDPSMDFERYQVLVLPDAVPVDSQLVEKLSNFTWHGGKILFTGKSGRDPETGEIVLKAGITSDGAELGFSPSYMKVESEVFADSVPRSPFVMYGTGQKVDAQSAEVLAVGVPSYFNRSYKNFCSHKHSPADLDALSLGPVMTTNGSYTYIAYPIFEMYLRTGQPIYKHLVQAALSQLLLRPILKTNLPSGGRASLTEQGSRKILHLLYGAPQQRGKQSPETNHPIELIEDIPTLAGIHASVRSETSPNRVFDATSGQDLTFHHVNGYTNISIDDLHIHAAVVLEFDE